MRSATLYKVLAALMVVMAAALVVTHTTTLGTLSLPLWAQVPGGVVAGFGIGVVAAIMGVAGGELLIPTIVLLFGVDIKIAGSLSLLVSLPTMLVAFARYSRDGSFAVLGANLRFAAGHGRRLDHRRRPGRPAARRDPRPGPHPRPRRDPADLRDQARPSRLTHLADIAAELRDGAGDSARRAQTRCHQAPTSASRVTPKAYPRPAYRA